MIAEFIPVARALIELSNLKIISFGPQPQDFLAYNAPVKQLFGFGVEIQENSELDLLVAFIALKGKFEYKHSDTFMGFHCGNTPMCRLRKGELKYQLIMKRLLEPDSEPDITRGTLEGDIAAGRITFFRLQGSAEGGLSSYIAQGEVLPVATRSFGGIGVFAIPEMGRFYRHVLIADHYPLFQNTHLG